MFKNKRFIFVSVIALLTMLLVLAACSPAAQPEEVGAEEVGAEEAGAEEAGAEEATMEPVTITVSHFFGAADDFEGVTELSEGVGEEGINRVLLNKFNAENDKGITLDIQVVDWDFHYDKLNTSFVSGEPPDVFIAHRSRLPDYTNRDLVAPLDDIFAAAGVDVNDLTPFTREGVTYGDAIYALPHDMHAILWHVNLDIMAEAGLVDEDGHAILPSSPEELMEHAAQVEEATGIDYISVEAVEGSVSYWSLSGLIAQQGSQLYDADGNVTVDTPETLNALTLFSDLFANGYADKTLDYDVAEQNFLNGKAAITLNGTWVVDYYDEAAADSELALANYEARAFPTIYDQPGVWADSHVWAVSAQAGSDPVKAAAIGEFLAYLFDNNYEWARTGHLPVRQSVLESEEFLSLPNRANFVDTGFFETMAAPPIAGSKAVDAAMSEALLPVWLLDTDPQEALSQAQSALEAIFADQ